MAQEQKQHGSEKSEETSAQEAKDLRNEDLDQSTEDVLDIIDDVLGDLTDEQAQEWTNSFVQKGGQASRIKKAFSDILTSWTMPGAALNAA